MYVYMYVCIYVCVCFRACVCMYICICMYANMHGCVYPSIIHPAILTYPSIHPSIHASIYANLSIHLSLNPSIISIHAEIYKPYSISVKTFDMIFAVLDVFYNYSYYYRSQDPVKYEVHHHCVLIQFE